MADADYIKARHKLIPAALKITSEALGIGLTDFHTDNSGTVGKSFDYSGFSGDCSKVMPVFLATMDRLYAESQEAETEDLLRREFPGGIPSELGSLGKHGGEK